MPQNAILFTSVVGPNGQTIVLRANAQGELVVAAAPGNSWYVNEATGSDTNTGSSNAPFKTLAAAQAAAVANNGDVVYLYGTAHLTATLNWAKNGVSLIGLNAPSQNDRARLSSSGTTVFTPMVNVTAQGCSFSNIGTFYGYVDAVAQVCWAEAGGRNFYGNVEFFGGGNATGAAQAGCRSLTIAGNGENEFVDCTFGLDTVVRGTAANATVEFLGGVQRNKFVRPIFQMDSSLATNVHIKAAASAVDRNQYMFDPIFSNTVDSGATALNADVLWDAAAGGGLILAGNTMSVGATAIAVAGPVYINGPVPTATTSGIGIKAT